MLTEVDRSEERGESLAKAVVPTEAETTAGAKGSDSHPLR
jgi:hypothetical protein